MANVIRPRQRALTAVLPHAQNRNIAVPAFGKLGQTFTIGKIASSALASEWETEGGSASMTELAGAAANGYQCFGQALRISSDSNSQGIRSTASQVIAAGDLSADSVITFIFWVNWPPTSGTTEIKIFLYSDVAATEYSAIDFHTNQTMQVGFNSLNIPVSWFTGGERSNTGHRQTAQPNWSNGPGGEWDYTKGVERVLIRPQDMSNASWDSDPYALHFCGMVYDFYARPQVAICFDDNYKNVISKASTIDYGGGLETCKGVMDRFGFKGNVAVIRDQIGTGSGDNERLDLTELGDLYNDGWDLVVHGSDAWSSANFATTQDCIDDEPPSGDGISYNQQVLETNNWKRGINCAVYPTNNYRGSGFATDNWIYNLRQKMQAQLEIDFARTSWPVWQAHPFLATSLDSASLFQTEYMSVGGLNVEGVTEPVRNRTDVINRMLANTFLNVGGNMVIYLHNPVNLTDFARGVGSAPPQSHGGSSTQYYVEDFIQICEWLNDNRDKIDVVTMSEMRRNTRRADPHYTVPSPEYASPAY